MDKLKIILWRFMLLIRLMLAGSAAYDRGYYDFGERGEGDEHRHDRD